MSKLSEIRNKLQQAQQAKSNAVAELDPKAKAKLEDLQEGRDQLKAARSKLDQWTVKTAKEELEI